MATPRCSVWTCAVDARTRFFAHNVAVNGRGPAGERRQRRLRPCEGQPGRLVMVGRLTALVSMAICILLMGEGARAAGPALPTLQPGVLRIGTYFVNPPFEYSAGGKHVGFEVDLMTDVARRLGLRPTFVATRWEVMLA